MRKSIGKSEWKVMEYILDRFPVTVREVATYMAETRGLARTSVLTVMERLRKKGHLKRQKKAGVWVYSPMVSKEALLRQSVKEFVETRLQGTLSPFMAYLTEEAALTEQDIVELRKLIADLDQKPQRGRRS